MAIKTKRRNMAKYKLNSVYKYNKYYSSKKSEIKTKKIKGGGENHSKKARWYHKLGAQFGMRSSKNIINKDQEIKKEVIKQQQTNTVLNIPDDKIYSKNKEISIKIEELKKKHRNYTLVTGKIPDKKSLEDLENMIFVHEEIFKRALALINKLPNSNTITNSQKIILIGPDYIPDSFKKQMEKQKPTKPDDNDNDNDYN